MYLAERDDGLRVALKEMIFAMVPSVAQLDAFEREGRVLASLNHPRIPRFVESFTDGTGVQTRLYLAHQFVPGVSLSPAPGEKIGEPEAISIAEKVLEILCYLHSLTPKVLHRDVKPANLIRRPDGEISLVDFGVARPISRNVTHNATLVGTFGYAPLEQLGGTVDERSDLYALGATLVHMLSGRTPEEMLTPEMRIAFADHVSVSVKTRRFLERLVAPQANERFATAKDALESLHGGEEEDASAIVRRPRVRTFQGIGLVIALAVVASGYISMRRVTATAEQATVAPVLVPHVQAQVPLETADDDPAPPPPHEQKFDWKAAEWDFGAPGRYLQDTSGRGHDALIPARGVDGTEGGLQFHPASQGIRVRDHADFAFIQAFTISAQIQLDSMPKEGRALIVARGEENGIEPFSLAVLPTGTLEFALMSEKGTRVAVRGPIQAGKSFQMVYATFDPTNSEMKVYAKCTILDSKETPFRPATRLDPSRSPAVRLGGSELESAAFTGVLRKVSLDLGIIEQTEPGSCLFSMVKFGHLKKEAPR